jgi:hypothetical protein
MQLHDAVTASIAHYRLASGFEERCPPSPHRYDKPALSQLAFIDGSERQDRTTSSDAAKVSAERNHHNFREMASCLNAK